MSGVLDLCGPKQVAKLSGNDWVSPIEDQLQVGLSHVFDYIRSETYKLFFVLMFISVVTLSLLLLEGRDVIPVGEFSGLLKKVWKIEYVLLTCDALVNLLQA
ncbi:unnamed protein product [Trichobilharzia regenti]|nr:unnamed protein product [Trichobilharzia regenti]